ncbi:MAG: hypothetical protein ACI31D_05230, partial [Candidatus Limisoma sp.]
LRRSHPQRIFDTLWILVCSAPMIGRTEPRPYYVDNQHNTPQMMPPAVGSRLGATEHGCGANRVVVKLQALRAGILAL